MPKPKRGTQASKRVANAKTNLANPSLHHPRQFPSEDNVRRTKLIMEKLDRKIEDLEGKIKKLQTQLQQLQQERANHASYISPLKRLPTELLSEIIGIYIKQGGEITTAAGVCSRLRQVVLGMAGIWSKISLREIRTRKDSGYWYRGNRNYGSSIEGGIICTTSEQLALVLTRARQSPLKLSVSWPVGTGTLELLASRNCPIHTLEVADIWDSLVDFSDFHDLNLDQLQAIRLLGLQCAQSRQIMDLALGSNCRKMTLDIKFGVPTLQLFQHELMQRVINLGVATRQPAGDLMSHLFQESSGLKEALLSNIETWRLEGGNDLFHSLNLSNAKNIEFLSLDYPMKPIVAISLGSLARLDLTCVAFAPDSLRGGQRQSLPCLTNLRLEAIISIGPFRKYFHCPKLEYLTYLLPSDLDPEEYIVEGDKIPYKEPIQQVFDARFFQETSALSFLSLGGTTIDASLARTLAACPQLRVLEIKDCHIIEFIRPFLQQLKDASHFPSLKTLSINDSWPDEIEMTYEEFMAQCSSKRAGIYHTGNKREEHAEHFSEDAELESDFDSMDEEEVESTDEEEW